MKDGKIKQAGKYNDILKSGSDFMELVGAHEEALSAIDSFEAGPSPSGGENTSASTTVFLKKQESQSDVNDKVDNAGGTKGQLVEEEEREKGSVGLSVYWKYITVAYGGLLVPFTLMAQVLFQVLQIGSNYWMAWATPVSKDMPPPVRSSTLIGVYISLAIGSALCISGRALLVATAGYKTATILCNKMHLSLFRAPMSFFDSTPSGRILNRVCDNMLFIGYVQDFAVWSIFFIYINFSLLLQASTDQSAVDLNMASIVGSFAFSIIQLLGIIAVMSQVAWQVFIVFIPVVGMCIYLQVISII